MQPKEDSFANVSCSLSSWCKILPAQSACPAQACVSVFEEAGGDTVAFSLLQSPVARMNRRLVWREISRLGGQRASCVVTAVKCATMGLNHIALFSGKGSHAFNLLKGFVFRPHLNIVHASLLCSAPVGGCGDAEVAWCLLLGRSTSVKAQFN